MRSRFLPFVLLLCLSSCQRTDKKMEFTPLANITPLEGELKSRLELNYERLEAPLFSFDSMTTAFSVPEAPGDWIGRNILSLSILSQVLQRESSPQLKDIMQRLPSILNAEGYVGRVMPDSITNEGYITGHNGFLRGLNEYYLWKKDPLTLQEIETILQNLFLKRQAFIDAYPTAVLKAQKEGGQVGHTVYPHTSSVWQGLSTDIGQFFLTLDALSQCYRIAPSPALKKFIELMITKFESIDFHEIGGQTHSFLGGLRGILNFYEQTNYPPPYLELVQRCFQQYQTLAMTANYENYNWFGRPAWTEGCAVTDSYMLATELWKVTGDVENLHLAHRILYNGIYANQRSNGGFGCNNCAGAKDQFCLYPAEIYEAPWCCSMRGSEALVRALTGVFCTDNEHIAVPFYQNAEARLDFQDGSLTLRMTTDYPYSGKTKIQVVNSTLKREKHLQLFISRWAQSESIQLKINGMTRQGRPENGFLCFKRQLKTNDIIDLEYTFNHFSESTPNGILHFHGPLLLGTETEAQNDRLYTSISNWEYGGEGSYWADGVLWSPVANMSKQSEEVAKTRKMQVLLGPEK